MPRILLLEDDDNIAFGIQVSLQKKGHTIFRCPDLVSAQRRFDDDIDLVLLDLNLPDGSGYDFCRSVKKIRDVPLIILTVRCEEAEIVKGLDMGADDYLCKPFLLSVLQSRVNAVLRRTKGNQLSVLTCCGLKLDKPKTKAYLDGQEVLLTAGEYRLLAVLMENKNQTLTRPRLLELLWDAEGSFVNDNTLTVTMKRLREKLRNPHCIKTLRGIGYRIEEEG